MDSKQRQVLVANNRRNRPIVGSSDESLPDAYMVAQYIKPTEGRSSIADEIDKFARAQREPLGNVASSADSTIQCVAGAPTTNSVTSGMASGRGRGSLNRSSSNVPGNAVIGGQQLADSLRETPSAARQAEILQGNMQYAQSVSAKFVRPPNQNAYEVSSQLNAGLLDPRYNNGYSMAEPQWNDFEGNGQWSVGPNELELSSGENVASNDPLQPCNAGYAAIQQLPRSSLGNSGLSHEPSGSQHSIAMVSSHPYPQTGRSCEEHRQPGEEFGRLLYDCCLNSMGTSDVTALIPSQSPIPASRMTQVGVPASAMFRPQSQRTSQASTSNAPQQPGVIWPKRVFTAPRRDVVPKQLEAKNRGGFGVIHGHGRGLRSDQTPRSRSSSPDSIREILRERKWEIAVERGGKAEYKCWEDLLVASNTAKMKESYRAPERAEIPSLFAVDVGPRARTLRNQLEFIPSKESLAAAPSYAASPIVYRCVSDGHRSRIVHTKDSRAAASIFAKALAYCSTESCSNANLEAHEKRKEERNALTHLQNVEHFDVDVDLDDDEVRGDKPPCEEVCASKLASVAVISCADKSDSVSVWPPPVPDHITVGSHILRFTGIRKGITASNIASTLTEFAPPDHFNVHVADGGATVICTNRKTACRIYEQKGKLRIGGAISMVWQQFDKTLWNFWNESHGVCFIPNFRHNLEFDNIMNGTVDLRTWLPKQGLDNVRVDVAF